MIEHIFHQYNDHCVNLKVATNFYEAVTENGQQELLKLNIYPFGNLSNDMPQRIGHFGSLNTKFHQDLADFIKNARVKTFSELSQSISAWRAHKF